MSDNDKKQTEDIVKATKNSTYISEFPENKAKGAKTFVVVETLSFP